MKWQIFYDYNMIDIVINEEFIWVKKSWIQDSEEDLNTHIIKLINIFDKLKDKLIILKNDWYKFQISVVYYYYWNNPWLDIDSKSFSVLRDLWIDVDIDFDIYSLEK